MNDTTCGQGIAITEGWNKIILSELQRYQIIANNPEMPDCQRKEAVQ